MAAISLGRFERWLEKYFNAKGGGVIADVDPSIQPVFELAAGNEDRYLQGWNRFGFSVGITAGAAQLAAANLHNPFNSGVIAVVELVGALQALSPAANSRFDIGYAIGGGDLPTPVAGVTRLDSRIQPGSTLIATTSTNAVVLAGNRILSGTRNNGVDYQPIVTVNQEIPLPPNSGLMVLDNVAAETVIFNFIWRERVMESSELT